MKQAMRSVFWLMLLVSAVPVFGAAPGPKGWLHHSQSSGQHHQTNHHMVTKHHSAPHPKRHASKHRHS